MVEAEELSASKLETVELGGTSPTRGLVAIINLTLRSNQFLDVPVLPPVSVNIMASVFFLASCSVLAAIDDLGCLRSFLSLQGLVEVHCDAE